MRTMLLITITLTFAALAPANGSAQNPLSAMCGGPSLSPQMMQLCQQAQQADQNASQALEQFKKRQVPRPRTMQEAVEMSNSLDHPVQWVRGADGHLYAISNDAPSVYVTPGVPADNPITSQPNN